MKKRTRLRRRLLGLTLLYGVLLIAIVFVLTWHARTTQRELQRYLEHESVTLASIDLLMRNQTAYVGEWMAKTATDAPSSELTRRYAAVEQLAVIAGLGEADAQSIRRAAAQFRALLREAETEWPSATQEVRVRRRSDIARASHQLLDTAGSAREALRRDAERRLPQVSRRADATMRVALALAYIVAIVSLALMRLMLRKVVEPLEELSRAAAKLAEGDFSARAPVAGDHEIAQLGESFNGMAGKIAALYDEARNRARTDDLTGMPNFRAFREVLAAEIERSSRYERRFGLLVFDLDHFKKYNDTWGHLAGNEALRAVAGVIRATLRTNDYPARYGGEEFAAVLPEVDHEGLGAIAERIRKEIARLPALEGRSRLTVSIGGSVYPEDGSSEETLFRLADERLYEAKSRGRNCVVIGTPSLIVES